MIQIWQEEKYPNDWNKGILIKLPKKRDLSNCNNWRGIALLPIVSKVFSRIILNRIQGPVNKKIRKEQAGFRASHSCIDHINTLRIIIEQSTEWKTGLYVTFMDFEKAFDSLNSKKIWRILKEYRIPHKIINLVKEMYQDSTLHILHEGALSKPIVANSGVKQGYVLSPTIFIIVMNYIIKMVTANKRRGITWKLTERLEDLDYADDICLLSQSYKDMKQKLEDLNKEAVKVGLKMNASKTKAMKINSKIKTKLQVNGNIIAETEKFQYLDSLVKINGGAEEDVNNRISKANSAFSQLNNIWTAGYLSLKTKIRIFESNAKSVLLYRCETWKSTAKIKRSMQAFINRCLQKILQIRWLETITNRVMGAYWTKTITQTGNEGKMDLDWPHTPQTIRNK
jgi:hypothetical protein